MNGILNPLKKTDLQSNYYKMVIVSLILKLAKKRPVLVDRRISKDKIKIYLTRDLTI